MYTRPDVMIIDTDRDRARSLRAILRRADANLQIEEVLEVRKARDAVFSRRPTVVLLHSTFPYLDRDGTGLVELIQEDFRNAGTGVILVLPISGSLLYRSGEQPGMEMLELADDVITTDYTSDVIQSVVLGYLRHRAAERVRDVAVELVPVEAGYAFVSKQV